MEATTFRSLLRLLLIHSIAVAWFAAELNHRAGFRLRRLPAVAQSGEGRSASRHGRRSPA